MPSLRTLFLTTNGPNEASMRFRVLQFQAPWRSAGHSGEVATFFSEGGGWARRVGRGFARRGWHLLSARRFDRVFVHRELLPLSWNDAARLLPKVPLIYDFDDAVYLRSTSSWRDRLARPETTRKLVERAALVMAGSPELADYARQFMPRVELVPTVVDTDQFRPAPARDPGDVLTLGWIGSPSTARYLKPLLSVLEALGKTARLRLVLVGAGFTPTLEGVEVVSKPWRLEEEVEAFQSIDIGLYPLEDDAWARGKCGFKAIQYMACGVPFVVRPVGAIHEIVENGVHGLHATSPDEWTAALRELIRDARLRATLAAAGRARAVERYSTAALAPRWIRLVENAG